jgi:ribosomal protein L21E
MAPTSKKAKAKKVAKVMKEYKAGTLHSGKGGPVVKKRKQAVAIAMSEAGMKMKKGKKK